jgi:diguanylate cyclase (GGDEF)-like protein
VPSKSTIAKVIVRLTLPGGVLLMLAAWVLRMGLLGDPSPKARLFPIAVVVVGLFLSAAFRRSRLFFALLVLATAQAALTWLSPHLSERAGHVLANGVALLVPLNLLALAFVRERGIISPAGRRRLGLVAVQIVSVGVLCLPRLAYPASWLDRPFFPVRFSAWSHVSQSGLVAFVTATAIMMVLQVRRYGPVESSLLWALVASFVALRMGGTSFDAAIFLAVGGLALIVALLETSYRMAYHDELTQLPSRRALNEALMKLPASYTIAMVDVDHFKKFNDMYGHESGDQALRLVASRLAYVTGGGKAYRYGGEEFAIVFPGRVVEDVFVYLDRLRRLIEQSTFVVRGKERRKGKKAKGRGSSKEIKKETSVTVSIGVAGSNGDHLAPAEVMRMADQALYKAKDKGRNCTVTARSRKEAGSERPSMRIVSVS